MDTRTTLVAGLTENFGVWVAMRTLLWVRRQTWAASAAPDAWRRRTDVDAARGC